MTRIIYTCLYMWMFFILGRQFLFLLKINRCPRVLHSNVILSFVHGPIALYIATLFYLLYKVLVKIAQIPYFDIEPDTFFVLLVILCILLSLRLLYKIAYSSILLIKYPPDLKLIALFNQPRIYIAILFLFSCTVNLFAIQGPLGVPYDGDIFTHYLQFYQTNPLISDAAHTAYWYHWISSRFDLLPVLALISGGFNAFYGMQVALYIIVIFTAMYLILLMTEDIRCSQSGQVPFYVLSCAFVIFTNTLLPLNFNNIPILKPHIQVAYYFLLILILFYLRASDCSSQKYTREYESVMLVASYCQLLVMPGLIFFLPVFSFLLATFKLSLSAVQIKINIGIGKLLKLHTLMLSIFLGTFFTSNYMSYGIFFDTPFDKMFNYANRLVLSRSTDDFTPELLLLGSPRMFDHSSGDIFHITSIKVICLTLLSYLVTISVIREVLNNYQSYYGKYILQKATNISEFNRGSSSDLLHSTAVDSIIAISVFCCCLLTTYGILLAASTQTASILRLGFFLRVVIPIWLTSLILLSFKLSKLTFKISSISDCKDI